MAYNFIDLRHKDVFATVGKNQVSAPFTLNNKLFKPQKKIIRPHPCF
jgi:hypothetical protein